MQVNLIRNTLQSNQDGRPIIKPLRVEFLAIAGGGGGAGTNTADGGGGGGAGGVITGSFCAEKFTPYPIVIGEGGAPKIGINSAAAIADNGENTTLFGVTALGGGGGATVNAQGANGGSGGGGGGTGGSGTQDTATYVGFGNDGGAEVGGFGDASGGGGGAGSVGTNTPSQGVGGNGGNGIELTFYTASALYGPGGAGAGINAYGTSGTGLNYGRGGNGGAPAPAAQPQSGSRGVAIIKYYGDPKATGGTIEQHSGVTYHFFTSGSINFEVIANEDNFALNNCNDGTSV
jgi:hypothetical protein